VYISEALVQKHQRRGPKQTGEFWAVLQIFPPTVPGLVLASKWMRR